MNTILSKFECLSGAAPSYWSERILSEIKCAMKLSDIKSGAFGDTVSNAVDFLFGQYEKEKTITKSSAEKTEELLMPLSKKTKEYSIICAAHAHIDMNWMWGYPETVAVTLDTFRTMLGMMSQYPDYKFSQSQASVYKIVQEHDADMLEEIKKRVREGRWEVTAGTWVETDKNMPCGESLARHILYTKKYLSQLLGIDPGGLDIDFQPDTFGHNLNVPEILRKGGVKYYYHCRGYDKHHIYKWRSPSGSEILVYREPLWYNSDIEPSMGAYALEFCSKHNIDKFLKVYGVGDHGGGPTRKDIEKIIDMKNWPIFPEISFGTFSEYFSYLDGAAGSLPVEDRELNFIFTGCYTSQSRIKMANRTGEARLGEAEAFSAIGSVFADGKYDGKGFAASWENILFNQFHDILPGSGIIDTREYAMGLFQQSMATANTEQAKAVRNIASKIDTSHLAEEKAEPMSSKSEGAGAGYGIGSFKIPQTERGGAKTRIFHVFNPSPYERSESVELVIWDWDVKADRITVKDAQGRRVRHQVLQKEKDIQGDSRYWGHEYIKVLVDSVVPAYGYATYTLGQEELPSLDIPDSLVISGERMNGSLNPRLKSREPRYVLESEYIKAAFDPKSMAIVSLYDKSSKQELVKPANPAGMFRYIKEDDAKGMTSWKVGDYLSAENLNEKYHCKITGFHTDEDSLCQWISYKIDFNVSKLAVKVSIDKNSAFLTYDAECDWQEKPVRGSYVPQLNFHVPVSYACEKYKYDIPFGTLEREPLNMDVSANSFMAGIGSGTDAALMLATDSKYGYRGTNDSMAVTLIRSSYDPDPYPELGIHKFKIFAGVSSASKNSAMIRSAFDLCHPMSFVSGTVHGGKLPLQKSFLSLAGENIFLSAVKMAESAGGAGKMIIRVYETEGKKAPAKLTFAQDVQKAYFVDLNENIALPEKNISCKGNCVVFETEPYGVCTICAEF